MLKRAKKKLKRVTSGAGDKKRKQLKQQEKQDGKNRQQSLPATSVDDVIYQDYDAHKNGTGVKDNNKDEGPDEDVEGEESRFERSTTHKILSSIRRRLGGKSSTSAGAGASAAAMTATTTTSSADTSVFIRELSAQIDPDNLEVIGDIELRDEEEEGNKSVRFGEKWSYLPSPPKDQPSTSAPPPPFTPPLPPLLVTNLDDDAAEDEDEEESEVIYDVPKTPVVAFRSSNGRGGVCVEDHDRSPLLSPAESIFDKAKKRNFRISGVSVAMSDVFTEAERQLEVTAAAASDEDETPIPITIPPPPPLPPPQIPPPPPPLPIIKHHDDDDDDRYQQQRMSVKRINWEKIEPVDVESTVWGQLSQDMDTINDVVKYLHLEQHFAVKRVAKKNSNAGLSERKRKPTASILSHKKAYNLSILLAHLKMTPQEIFNCLLINAPLWTRNKLDPSHYDQLLFYCPDDDEWDKCRGFDGVLSSLNEADQFAIKMSELPEYETRLRAFVFKLTFAEKEAQLEKNFQIIQSASIQLRRSQKLAKILEFVLAMGNYMNQGNVRIAKATGFRIHFLAEMDCTKTSDNKLTFLHILARAIYSKFPHVVDFSTELTDVAQASRVVYPHVLEELQDLRMTWTELRDSLDKFNSDIKTDRFKVVMQACLMRTNISLKRLESLHSSSMKDFRKATQYFGENSKNIGVQQFFSIFDNFIRKFEKSQKEIKNLVKTKSTAL